MALTKQRRHRAPNDGSWFCTTANMNSLLRAMTRYDDESNWPKSLDDTRVPVWVRMVQYKAQETRQRPDGMIYGPIVRIGTMDSPDVEMFGSHHAAGLSQDYALDGADQTDKWIYVPYGYDVAYTPGEDVSTYRCDQCNADLFRDDLGRRQGRSACIYDGALVCRDCDARGLVYDYETEEQLIRCRHLADYLGHETRLKFEDYIERLAHGFCCNHPAQTRLFREDKYSFAWGTTIFTEEGKKRGMNGGLIKHGPHVTQNGYDYKFTAWDYKEGRDRPATQEEIKNIHWSIHT